MKAKKNRLQNNPLAWMETKKVEIKGTRLSDVQYVSPKKLNVNPLNSDFFKEETTEYFDKLREDINARGIIVPLLAKKDDTLLAGHNRLKVALELGLENVPVQYVLDALPEQAEKEFIIKDNLFRRQFSSSEWIALYKKLYPDFDKLILQETRGGGLKWSKQPVGETEAENDDTQARRLTAQKIAKDTGQNLSAVQKQLTKYRKSIASPEYLEKSKRSNTETTKEINTALVKETRQYFLAMEKKIVAENIQTRKQILAELEAFKEKLSKLTPR
jgi:disulfide oxidoreductase YuzD